ncbi:NADH-quinone oxidoreductase subunit C [Aquihabitans daechungensis]|uniref:NADH-quinone oxidoreductase subunit C n=1 Tax=Aquihabitans daechungensis TaxID=1052257 RepID=UPI003BA2EF86
MEEAPEAPEVDEVRQALIDKLTEELGEAVVGSHVQPGHDVWVRVTREAWRTAGLVARDQLGFRYFEYLSAIDWLPSPFGLSEDSPTDAPREPDTKIVTGYAGGDTRFQVIARVHSLAEKVGIHFKVDLPDEDLSIPTWLPVYAGVNWHEREIHEMFGIDVVGHPYLLNLYLPGEFEGHPLRKDFPLLARHVKPWPGIVDVEPMPASDDEAEATDATDATETEEAS